MHHAFEFLKAHNIVSVIHHASEGKAFSKGYPKQVIQRQAEQIRAWNAQGLNVYAYFWNRSQIHAPFCCLSANEGVKA